MLPKAIESVIAQEYSDWELIIIDDGSTDNTPEIVSAYSDSRIKYHRNDLNQERSASRNLGIEKAHGKYICFLDSDDYCLPNHLLKFSEAIENQGSPVAVFYCNTLEDTNGELREIPNAVIHTENTAESILVNIIGIPRMCIHKEILEENKFNPAYSIGEDLDLLSRILQTHELISTGMFTTVYLNHADRSVHLKNAAAFLTHLDRVKEIIRRDISYSISDKIRKIALSNAYFNLAEHYDYVGSKSKTIQYAIYSLVAYPFLHWKKKLHVILRSSLLTRWLLRFRKMKI